MAIEFQLDSINGEEEVGNISQKLQIVNQRCLTLERLLLFGEVSSIPRVVHDFKAMSEFYLIQLSKEIEIYRYCPEERAELLDFLKYLRSVTQEIEDMMFLVKE
jgi:hypothetical protein